MPLDLTVPRNLDGSFIEPGAWLNPSFDSQYRLDPSYLPDYSRFDWEQVGSGITRAQTYQDGAWLFDRGYVDVASKFFKGGVTAETATDKEKFLAVDAYFRNAQRKNQKTNKFGDSLLGKILGVAIPIATSFIPGLQGWAGAALKGFLGGALTGVVSGGNFTDILKAGGLGIPGALAGEAFTNYWNTGGIGITDNPGVLGTGASINANPVPGNITGITTPTGGGITGSGNLNPAAVGLQGGPSLGANPLAVLGGAANATGPAARVAKGILDHTLLSGGGPLPGTNQIYGPPTPPGFQLPSVPVAQLLTAAGVLGTRQQYLPQGTQPPAQFAPQTFQTPDTFAKHAPVLAPGVGGKAGPSGPNPFHQFSPVSPFQQNPGDPGADIARQVFEAQQRLGIPA